MDVDLEDTGVWRELQAFHTEVAGRFIALEQNRHGQLLGGCLHRGYEVKVMLEASEWRQKYVQPALARLNAERGAHHLHAGAGWSFIRIALIHDPGVHGPGGDHLAVAACDLAGGVCGRGPGFQETWFGQGL